MAVVCLIMVKMFFAGHWNETARLVQGRVVEVRPNTWLVRFKKDSVVPERYLLGPNPAFVEAKRCDPVEPEAPSQDEIL